MNSTAIADITAERERQISFEGWSPDHDDAHGEGQIAFAAACYSLSHYFSKPHSELLERLWPWAFAWWKPTDRRRDLVKAGALIVAEIDRLDRVAAEARAS
jgi:hypothetical protein